MKLQEDVIRMIFGLKLKQLRSDKNLSLTELATITGISVSYLNEIEKGKKHPKPSKSVIIADALGVSYDYLVSLKLNKRLQPVGELLQSNILSELPLEHFGLDMSRLLDLFATAPAKLSAFITTLLEISRAFDLRVEQFYFTALRSYQELHDNYFDDIELKAELFLEEFQLEEEITPTYEELEAILLNQFNITIQTKTFIDHPELATLRSVFLPGNNPILILNPSLTPHQKTFAIAREIGFQYLDLKERPYTSTWVKVGSFDEVLNNFKASYFASALLLNQDRLVEDMSAFFSERTWKPELLEMLIAKYNTSPETLLHRLTSVLPKFFGIKQLFFLRFKHEPSTSSFYLTKELHLSGLHNPHASFLNEHYCRRWISLTLFEQIEHEPQTQDTVIGLQRSSYINSDNEYLVLALAQPSESRYGTVSLGLLIKENLNNKVSFLNDPAILKREVNETCERCPALDCQERVAPPVILDKILWQEQVIQTLEKIKTNEGDHKE